jgi:hypothetical protein
MRPPGISGMSKDFDREVLPPVPYIGRRNTSFRSNSNSENCGRLKTAGGSGEKPPEGSPEKSCPSQGVSKIPPACHVCVGGPFFPR